VGQFYCTLRCDAAVWAKDFILTTPFQQSPGVLAQKQPRQTLNGVGIMDTEMHRMKEMTMTDDFNWVGARNHDQVVVPEQAAIAVYENPNGDVVIRQQAALGSDDHIIYIQPVYLPRLIASLEGARQKPRREQAA
jgi:hypothetical protein